MGNAALIDEHLPIYDVVERHQTVVRAPRETVYETVRRLDMRRSPIIRALFELRSVPALLSRSSSHRSERLGLTLDGLLQSGFIFLGERLGEELLLGLVGRFWTFLGSTLRTNADDFHGFQRPGYAKAAWDFRLDEEGSSTLLTTETRVLCTDEASRSKFRLYWAVIGPFSGLIRKEILRVVKSKAEDDTRKVTT